MMLGLDPGAVALTPEEKGTAAASRRVKSPRLRPGFCLALGGNATAGRFVTRPWPQLLEQQVGRMVVNFARLHAGLDAMLGDAELLRAATLAELRLIELPDAINLSNPFYTVHPRRNDRFLRADAALTRLYPEIDFTEYTFTRHMILSLWAQDAVRFEQVRQVLAACWITRMELLIERLEGRTVLIWWGNRPPLPPGAPENLRPGAPQLVDRQMLTQLRPAVDGLVEMVQPDMLSNDTAGIDAKEGGAARELPGASSHASLARHLVPWLRRPAR